MSVRSGVITGIRVTHRRATVESIAAVSAANQRTAVSGLLSAAPVEEAFVLQTCNRAEAYVVTSDPEDGRAAVDRYAADAPDDATAAMDHEESVRHLLRVACGLESLLLGEDQILGQVRDAYEDARGAGGIGPILETAVTKAIHAGERARTETRINEGALSLGSAAARVVARERDLEDATALVVGAGEMGRIAAQSLAARDVERVTVANRTVPHAEHVADVLEVPAEGVGLDAVEAAVDRADVLVAATASDEPVVPERAFEGAGETVVVDLGQPRDVAAAAGERETVVHHDLDDLEDLTDRTRRRRREAVAAVEAIVEEAAEQLFEQFKRQRADEVIASMYESAERVKERELEQAIEELPEDAVGDEHVEVLESMADALVGQLLAAPTKSLREAAAEDDWSTIHTALQLFDPDFGDEAPSAVLAAIEEGARAED